MKLQADRINASAITAYGSGWIAVNGQRHHNSLVLSSSGERQTWSPACFEDLHSSHFEALLGLSTRPPALVLFGSGEQLRFPLPILYRCLIERGIGMETMDTPAACRTYNFLAAEGRQVVLAVLV